jgi:hypothetical protein
MCPPCGRSGDRSHRRRVACFHATGSRVGISATRYRHAHAARGHGTQRRGLSRNACSVARPGAGGIWDASVSQDWRPGLRSVAPGGGQDGPRRARFPRTGVLGHGQLPPAGLKMGGEWLAYTGLASCTCLACRRHRMNVAQRETLGSRGRYEGASPVGTTEASAVAPRLRTEEALAGKPPVAPCASSIPARCAGL